MARRHDPPMSVKPKVLAANLSFLTLLDKLRAVRKLIDESGRDIRLEIDGVCV